MKKATIIYYLKEMEWIGSTQGGGASIGSYSGEWFSSCHICGGLEDETVEFIEEAWGHTKSCWLALAIKEN